MQLNLPVELMYPNTTPCLICSGPRMIEHRWGFQEHSHDAHDKTKNQEQHSTLSLYLDRGGDMELQPSGSLKLQGQMSSFSC